MRGQVHQPTQRHHNAHKRDHKENTDKVRVLTSVEVQETTTEWALVTDVASLKKSIALTTEPIL